MRDKVVDGDVNRLPRLDVPQCRDHQVVVERIWTGGHNTKYMSLKLQDKWQLCKGVGQG